MPDNIPQDIYNLFAEKFDTVSAGVLVQSKDGVIDFANEAACKILGINREDLLQRNLIDLKLNAVKIDGTVFTEDEYPANVVLRTKLPENNVVIGIQPPGFKEIRWLHADLVPAFKPGTEEIGEIVSTFIDITDHIQAEQVLEHRTQQLSALSSISIQLNSILETSVVIRTLVTCAMELVDASSGATGLLENGRLEFREYNLRGNIVPLNVSLGPGEGVPGLVMTTHKPYISNDAEHDPYVIQEIRETLGFGNLIGVPILSRTGEFLGCFEIHNKKKQRTL